MKVLVTGGSGFIGGHLARALSASGHDVASIDISPPSSANPLPDSVRVFVGDIRNPNDLDVAMVGAKVVFHLAAATSVEQSWDSPRDVVQVNEIGTINVLEACARASARRLVFARSAAVYGLSPETPTAEDQPITPSTPYGVSKASAELGLRILGPKMGVDALVLRFFNVFGPGQDVTSAYASVIPRFVSSALTNQPVTIYGDGLQTRDFVYVDNVVAALVAAGTRRTRIDSTLNIGAGRANSIKDLLKALESLVALPIKVRNEEARAGDPRRSLADIQAARRELGYEPTVTFEEGLSRVVEWWRERLATGGWAPAGQSN